MSKISVTELEKKAKQARRILIEMMHQSNIVAHLGGSFSAMDLAVAVYAMFIPDLNAPGRSRLVLSKGHVAVMAYAILYSYGCIKEDEFCTLKQLNSRLQGHPDINKIPEMEMNTGLLGQGLAVAMGMAYGRKLTGNTHKIFALCGDAELHEGQIWETAQQAAHFKLDNLVAIIDCNKLSSHDPVDEVINLGSLQEKFTAFGWDARIIEDGNDMHQILDAFEGLSQTHEKPVVFIAHTVKGKGVSLFENNPDSHSITLNGNSYQEALAELS